MKYSLYLKSEHWLSFRKEILKERKRCQNCNSLTGLQIHHRNYYCLGKETTEDVIVLCGRCHDKFHKKKKWQKAYKKRENLDFTFASPKSAERLSKVTSEVLRKCPVCADMHPVFYRAIKGGMRLAMFCLKSKPRTKWIKFEEGLDIPILGSRKEQRYAEKLKRDNLDQSTFT